MEHGQAQLLATSHPGQNNWLDMSPEPMSPSAAGTQTSRETLWEEAYDSLQARNSRLVTWYETILTLELKSTVANLPSRNASSDTFRNLIDQRDWETRRGKMKHLLGLWFRGNGVFLFDIIRATASMTPEEAVLAWVAASYAASKKSAGNIEQPKPSRETTQVLNYLNVLDHRPSISAVEIDSSHPTDQLYRALFSTKEYEFFRGWDSTTEPENQLLWVRGEPGVGKTMLLTGTVRTLLSATAQDKSDRCFLSFYLFDRTEKRSNNAALALRTIIWPFLCTNRTLAGHGRRNARLHSGQSRDLTRTNKYDEDLEEEMVRELHSASQGNYLWNHFLDWVEDLVLREQLSAAAAKLEGLDLSLQRRSPQDPSSEEPLAAAIRDAHLFLRLRQLINSPKGVHGCNTLLFCLMESHDDYVRSVAFSSDRKLIASGSDDSSVRVWYAETGTTQHRFTIRKGWMGSEVNCLPDQPGIVHAACFSDDGSKLAAASSRAVRIWDLDSEVSASRTFKSYDIEHTATNVEKDANGGKKDTSELEATNENTEPEEGTPVINTENWLNGRRDSDRIERSQPHLGTETTKLREPLHRLKGHTGAIRSIVFSSDSKNIASGSNDSTVRIWELDTEEPEARKPLDGRRGAVNSVALAAYKNGHLLASCTERVVDFWDFGNGEHQQVMRSPCRILCGGLAASPNRAYLAAGSYEGTVDLWHAPRKRIEQEPEPASWVEPRSPIDMALSPDGRTLAVAQVGEDVLLWDIETNELVNPRIDTGHTTKILSVSFSPKHGAMLLSSGADCSVRVCDVKTGMRLHKFLGHTDWIGFSTWSPNGDYVVSALDDGTIRIWKMGDRDEQGPQILEQGDCFATGVSFSPDGKHIATCGTNGKVMVWASQKDESGWNLKHTLEGHRSYVLSVLISRDSKQVLSSGADKTIRIWDIESGDNVNKDSPIETELHIDKMRFDKNPSSHVMTP
ncbi:WD40 repeat-like-containing domain protein [Metarhizium robertsii ARSEF 23]|uniref:Mitochondrial division protein 1 n=1 Tax=Metarhizium robertsii (strain ARSEF 23 / ATCC MYA-3075) TaxID=655844 RepID=E9FAF6_METRA|nr:WD40 repeat-like-containing domain protein [Metarhizium robertsii ARSEF 23]EFY95306.2 WD40 repeat-like-containing domain protein [Metarhizium robertsii ARSEF 23]